MRVLIITSCTGEKKYKPINQLNQDDFRKGPKHISTREKELKDFMLSSGRMYTGEQHIRLMRGVEACRTKGIECEVKILSAGYGFIKEDRLIAPYESTFATMKAKELRDWAQYLKAPEDFRSAMAEPYDFGLILLGDNYLKACMLDAGVKLGGMTLLFAGSGPAKKLPRIANLRVVTLSNPEAKRFSCGLVGLKGELACRLIRKLSEDSDLLQQMKDPATDVLSLLDNQDENTAKAVIKSSFRPNPNVDRVITIPQSWWDKPHRKKMRYFIPEWDDLVDPDYDFSNDDHSGGKGDWSNEVYAHQMYPEPNYDGILMSRAVAEKSKRKKERINALGVHRFLRVPREFPIMGDCGAFDYIMEDVPPYTTDEVIDYYTRLDFDYGVSVDHLIVAATEEQKKFRYELTINNAEEFIKAHHKAGLMWEPIGAVQGWDPESYAKAASQYVKMGYRYIALGGLVRTKSVDILTIVGKVREQVPSSISIHLFGVARLDTLEAFAAAGIQSADSASYLRQAWMRVNQSYASFEGPYAALRIPEAGKSFRAKHMLNHPEMTEEKISKMEQMALNTVRAFANNKCNLDTCLNALLEYDQFVTAERVDMGKAYRRTLEARPWEKCECEICRKWGIEVAIFRGNNRNRRRGFHNTYIFYRLLQDIISGKSVAFLKKDVNQQTLSFNMGTSCATT